MGTTLETMGGIFGSLPGAQRLQIVPRAEAYALLAFLRALDPFWMGQMITPLEIYSDNQDVVDQWNYGPTFEHVGKNADLWDEIWVVGGPLFNSVRVPKVKGYVALVHEGMGIVSARERWGNHLADRLADHMAQLNAKLLANQERLTRRILRHV